MQYFRDVVQDPFGNAVAVAEVLRFYAPFGNTLDASQWRVSIEDFEWQDAVYRIDVAVDERPTYTHSSASFPKLVTGPSVTP